MFNWEIVSVRPCVFSSKLRHEFQWHVVLKICRMKLFLIRIDKVEAQLMTHWFIQCKMYVSIRSTTSIYKLIYVEYLTKHDRNYWR